MEPTSQQVQRVDTNSEAITKYLANNSKGRLVISSSGTDLELRPLTWLEAIKAKFGFGPAAFKEVVNFCNTHGDKIKFTAEIKNKLKDKITDYNKGRLPISFKKVSSASLQKFLALKTDKKIDRIEDLLSGRTEFTSGKGFDALVDAIGSNRPEFVQPLINKGADVNHPGGKLDVKGWTPLHFAAHYNNLPIVEKLIELGADPSIKCQKGETPAMIAAIKCGSRLISKFIVAGVDVNARSSRNETLLMLAAQSIARNPKETFEVLLKAGANVNLQNNLGDTALHMAISFQPRLDAIKTLLASPEIDVNIKNNKGVTPLELARRMELTDVVEALLEKGAK